ncbi:hypothetical protein F0344_32850 [Streptomyces finlayi]|uniref:DUF6895 domain-containing protein n=1 Tax=Streptomyces finlayi TaxID=67296 RepID=A0A7G7BTU1_9ACTN|nr:hypothetical protein [Streptomyces finlayi]QNE78756.1 hypothetical protein F0344_32850 [Streptomyces finlayi]
MPSPLEQLSSGALDWLGKNLDHFDPFSASARSATYSTAKAALELALLCHCAARADDGRQALSGATALVRKLWQDPDFPRLFDDTPAYASTYGLVYAALAPDGVDDAQRRAALARLAPDLFSPEGKSPYRRIEIRYYADKAGVHHGMETYAELLPRSPLATLHGVGAEAQAPLSTSDAYALTHTGFYLGDFGRTDSGVTGRALAHAHALVSRMLRHCVAHDRWDLAAELVLTQFILGSDPLSTPSGAAAVECLVRAQRPDGAIPARSAALLASPSAPAGELFGKAYHTTLVTALMALIVSSPRPS